MNIDLTKDIPMDVEIILDNGRKFKVKDSGQPYVNQEYPTGGFIIFMFDERFKPFTKLARQRLLNIY